MGLAPAPGGRCRLGTGLEGGKHQLSVKLSLNVSPWHGACRVPGGHATLTWGSGLGPTTRGSGTRGSGSGQIELQGMGPPSMRG